MTKKKLGQNPDFEVSEAGWSGVDLPGECTGGGDNKATISRLQAVVNVI